VGDEEEADIVYHLVKNLARYLCH